MNIKKVNLQVPALEDLWFRRELLNDERTMEYNAGYKLDVLGYDYNTGCIDFPRENWENWFNNKVKNNNFFYAYIVDIETNAYIGETNFSINSNGTASMGIVIKAEYRNQGYMQPALAELIKEAKRRGVDLTNDVPKSRESALKGFKKAGFICVGEYEQQKFGKPEKVLKLFKKV